MEYILSEIAKRKDKNFTVKVVLVGIISVVILNIFITSTNNIPAYRNTICFVFVLIYCFVMYFLFRKMLSSFIYNLGDNCINFQRQNFNKKKDLLTVKLDDIKYMDKYSNIIANFKVQKIYFFVYGSVDDDEWYYCEYKTNDKLYRFVFKPSERLIRILERKIGNRNYEH